MALKTPSRVNECYGDLSTVTPDPVLALFLLAFRYQMICSGRVNKTPSSRLRRKASSVRLALESRACLSITGGDMPTKLREHFEHLIAGGRFPHPQRPRVDNQRQQAGRLVSKP